MKESMIARAGSGGDGESGRVLAPAVGRYLCPPPPGTRIEPGSPCGLLQVMNRTYRLLAPDGTSGIVSRILAVGRTAQPVEYGEPLLSLVSSAGFLAESEGGAAESAAPREEEVPQGMLAIRSPTDGIFYRRPSPEEPAYVKEGDEIDRGKILALVEVMKCFNQITFGGPGMPDRAKVVRVLPEDSAEVKLGQPLVVLEPG